jgi:hypothetical protein
MNVPAAINLSVNTISTNYIITISSKRRNKDEKEPYMEIIVEIVTSELACQQKQFAPHERINTLRRVNSKCLKPCLHFNQAASKRRTA